MKAVTDSSGTIEIGVSESILADTPLCSTIDANTAGVDTSGFRAQTRRGNVADDD